ncbi:MAG: hypothetical protein PHC80_07750 [Eubacteriales bacterium]|nr:hypothetical protein [Eubacteriales bacterium]
MHEENTVFITEEKLADMRAKAQMMEDELHDVSVREYQRTGKLSNPKLCEMTLEYENYLLSMDKVEALLEALKEEP